MTTKKQKRKPDAEAIRKAQRLKVVLAAGQKVIDEDKYRPYSDYNLRRRGQPQRGAKLLWSRVYDAQAAAGKEFDEGTGITWEEGEGTPDRPKSVD